MKRSVFSSSTSSLVLPPPFPGQDEVASVSSLREELLRIAAESQKEWRGGENWEKKKTWKNKLLIHFHFSCFKLIRFGKTMTFEDIILHSALMSTCRAQHQGKLWLAFACHSCLPAGVKIQMDVANGGWMKARMETRKHEGWIEFSPYKYILYIILVFPCLCAYAFAFVGCSCSHTSMWILQKYLRYIDTISLKDDRCRWK